MSKVFGIGWAKTGTTTLGTCLRSLGYDHQSQNLSLVTHLRSGNLTPIFAVAERKESFEDWPWILLFKEMDEQFPGSKFILTVRDPDGWLGSYRNMLKGEGCASEELNAIRRTLYGLPFPEVTDEQLLSRYQEHNRQVQTYFNNRPGDLLVVNWGAGDGWAELCRFLERDVPGIPFPHANKGSYRQTRPLWRQVAARVFR